MQINFLTFIPYQDDLISINKIDLSTDPSHTLTINLLSSYNGTDFRPATLELDTTANASSMTLNIDLFQVLIEPGTYFVRNISGASVVSIVSSEQVTINFYRSFKPERMIITNRNKADNVVSRSIYNSWGVNGNNLSAIYNAAAKEWRWNVTNLPPFNDGANISNAHLILNSDANRLFMIMQGTFVVNAIAGGSVDETLILLYSQTSWGVVSPCAANPASAGQLASGAWYLNAPLFTGALYLGVSQPVSNNGCAGVAPPDGTTRNIGNIIVEAHGFG